MKVCPFCNAEIPEESVYCLNCAAVLNERQIFPVVKEKKKKKAIILFPRKKIMSAVAVVLSLVIVISSCLFAVHSSRNDTPKTEEKKTTLVPVTEENGESVTDDNGEQVFEVTEIIEATTEKQGLLDKLFGKDDNGTNNNDGAETTTKKQSFLDKIFGNDENDEKDNTSTSTTEPEATTTEPSTTEIPESSTAPTTTSTTESTTESTTIPVSDTEYCTFEYEVYMFNQIKNIQYVRIKKYTGNAKNVIVPSKIDGFYVSDIAKYAFSNNDNIETVSFEEDSSQPLLTLSTNCFNNCANLHTINIPVKTMGMSVSSIQKCYSMSKITVTNSNYKFEDGKLYYKSSSGWLLIYWCPTTVNETYTIPSWCEGIQYACNLNEISKLKTINMHKDCTMFPSGGYIHQSLENIYIDDANPNGYDINGVAICTNANSSTTYAVFPGSNKTKDFTIPDNVKLYVSASFYTNPYLETLRISKNAQYTNKDELFTNSIFTNLKTIYIQSGHENEEHIRSKFKGNIYTY